MAADTLVPQKPLSVSCLKITAPEGISMAAPVMEPNDTSNPFSPSRSARSPLDVPPMESTAALIGASP
ncbi:hypothetical protein D3C87_2022720 [compost metagenome]